MNPQSSPSPVQSIPECPCILEVVVIEAVFKKSLTLAINPIILHKNLLSISKVNHLLRIYYLLCIGTVEHRTEATLCVSFF